MVNSCALYSWVLWSSHCYVEVSDCGVLSVACSRRQRNVNNPGLDLVCGQRLQLRSALPEGNWIQAAYTPRPRESTNLVRILRGCAAPRMHTEAVSMCSRTLLSLGALLLSLQSRTFCRSTCRIVDRFSYSSLICRSCEQPSAVRRRLHLSTQSACLAVLANATRGHTNQHKCHQLHRQQQPTASTALCRTGANLA